jgi:hypothetical protein
LQVTQILRRFLPAFDGTAGLVDVLQLDQRRRVAPAFRDRSVPRPICIAQAQCTDAAKVVDRQQVVQLGEGRQSRIYPTALGMVAGDDASAPGIWRGICDRTMEHGIMGRCGFVRLVARHHCRSADTLKHAGLASQAAS